MAEANPPLIEPRRGRHILEWFSDASATRRYDNGAPCRITPLEWAAWAEISGNIVTRDEMAIMKALDGAFVKAVAEERADQAARDKR